MAENLWPDFNIGDPIITPATIMKEQAQLFDEKMKGKLHCFVASDPSFSDSSIVNTKMYISAQKLGNYTMRLLSVQYSLTGVFPCALTNEVTSSKEEKIASIEEFRQILTKELAKPEVVRVIQVLYSQVVSM